MNSSICLEQMGSSAEQDRHESHFGFGVDGLARLKQAGILRSLGAEQDRYEGRFGGKLNGDKITESFKGASGAEQDKYEGHFGLGADGIEKMKKVKEAKGVGAEQACWNHARSE